MAITKSNLAVQYYVNKYDQHYAPNAIIAEHLEYIIQALHVNYLHTTLYTQSRLQHGSAWNPVKAVLLLESGQPFP
jgi:hypothetical protein